MQWNPSQQPFYLDLLLCATCLDLSDVSSTPSLF